MADDSPGAYEVAKARSILARLARLERNQNSLLGGGYNQSFTQGPLVTRWGKTSTTPDYPTYPTSGNVVGVKLGDYEPSPLYPGATATNTFTAYEPPVYVFATLTAGSIPSSGTVVAVTWRNGRWWIDGSSVRKRASMISPNVANCWRDGAGAYSAVNSGTTTIIGYDGSTTKDVKFWSALSGCSTNDEGTAFTWVNAPSAYSDNWLTLKQTGYVKITCLLCVEMNECDTTDRDAYLLQDSHYHVSSAGAIIPGNTGVTTAQGLRLETLLSGTVLTIATSDGSSASSVLTYMPAIYTGTGRGTRAICQAIAICYRGNSDEYVNISASLATHAGGQLYVKPRFLNTTVEQIGDSGQF